MSPADVNGDDNVTDLCNNQWLFSVLHSLQDFSDTTSDIDSPSDFEAVKLSLSHSLHVSHTGMETGQQPSETQTSWGKCVYSLTSCEWLLTVTVKLTAKAPITKAQWPVSHSLIATGGWAKSVSQPVGK